MSVTKPLPNSDLQKSDVVNAHTGEKWLYSEIVKEHFFHPRNLLLEEPTAEAFDARGTVGSPACLHPDTLVETARGAQKIATVNVGEKVIGADGYAHAVTRRYEPRSTSTLIALQNPLGTLVATPDHLVYGMQIPRGAKHAFVSTRFKQRQPRAWFHAGDLRVGDVVLYPVPQETQTITSVPITQSAKNKFASKSKALPARLPICAEVLELLGYFVAEGHTRTNNSGFGFTFSDQEMKYVRRVTRLMKKYFYVDMHIEARPAQHRIDVSGYSVQLIDCLREWCGHDAAHKRVPDFILTLSPKLQAAFLRGVWRGDGHLRTAYTWPRGGYTTISPVLAQQMRRLLLRQRIVPALYVEPAHTTRGTRHATAYRLHVGDVSSVQKLARIVGVKLPTPPARKIVRECWFDKNYLYVPVRHADIRPATKMRLYNFEVATVHSYATDAFLVHNCGDVMDIWIKVDPATERVTDLKWKTFGCGSAIAATSMFSVMVTENGGMTLAEALQVKPQDIMMRLGGLPNRKIHCSVLADKAFRKAVNNYFHATGQHDRVIVEGARVVDARLNVTDKDIEEAVLEGAQNVEEVQRKLKVGVGDPAALPEIEQLIRFYKEKYFGA